MATFLVDCVDNDSYAFRAYPSLTKNQRIHQALVPDMSGNERAGPQRCPKCRELLAKWQEPLHGLALKKRTLDISCTYDGVTIASQKFVDSYKKARLRGLRFRKLPDDPDFYSAIATREVEFDAAMRKTRFENLCNECGRFESVTGATPVFLRPGTAIGDNEFVRTDLEFATGDEKHPLLLCGAAAAKTLKAARLKGLDLSPVELP